MEEGIGYQYKGTPEPLMLARKLVPKFEIFANYVNRVKEAVIKEAIVEELALPLESKEDIAPVKLKDAAGQEEELDFKTYVVNSIMDVFYNDFKYFIS